MKELDKKEAYLISEENELICVVDTNLKNGERVSVSGNFCMENIDANREFNLVNSVQAKVSRAKKWERKSNSHFVSVGVGVEIHARNFLLKTCN